MDKPNVLFLNGIRDDYEAEVARINAKGQVLYRNSGTCDIHTYLKPTSFQKHLITLDLNPKSQIVLPKNLVLIVNQISEADTHKKCLFKVKQLQKVLPPSIQFINAPQAIIQSRRETIYQNLKDISGVLIPKTVRSQVLSPAAFLAQIKQEEMCFPILIREAGAHGGKTTVLLEDEDAVLNLFSIAMDGRDYYLTEYIDYSRDGFFHKARIVVVEGRAFLRHAFFSKHWMVHRKNMLKVKDEFPEKYAEEAVLLENFDQGLGHQIQPIITAIYQAVKLDYFGIDCDIRPDGSLLVFEVNANMLTLKKHETSQGRDDKPVLRIKHAINEMIMKRMAAG